MADYQPVLGTTDNTSPETHPVQNALWRGL